MTMPQKSIGILGVSVSGRTLTDKEKVLLAHPKVGALALYRENWNSDPEAADPKSELKSLIKEVRAINPDLLITVDHEGGKIWRFHKGFTHLPSAKSYGQIWDNPEQGEEIAIAEAYKNGMILARELKECGIDASFAPVVDLDGPSKVIGAFERAFHRDPQVVVKLASAFIKGMNKAGMLAIIKHFPGHGSCDADSHKTVPVDDRSMTVLQRDLQPFREILSNERLLASVMTNFVLYPQVDANNVAGFSKTWINGTLRMGCQFDGLVVSDCLSMTGADVGAQIKRIAQAQAAGNDLILMTHQHGDKLDDLLEILDQIQDTPESAQRRQAFATRIREVSAPGMLSHFNKAAEKTAATKSIASISEQKVALIANEDNSYNTHKGIV